MENASKALLMAGSVLMAMIILGMLVLMFNNVTHFFSEDSQAKREEQILKYNSEYESYNRDNVRGTDMLSLLAKVKDYNIYQADYEGTNAGYKPMKISVKIPHDKKSEFDRNIKYNSTDQKVIINAAYSWIQDNNNDAYTTITNVKTEAKGQLKENVAGKVNGEKKEITDSNMETLVASLALMESTENLLKVKSNSYTVSEIEQLQKTLALMQNVFHPNVTGYSGTNDFNKLIIDKSSSTGIKALKEFYDTKYNPIMEYTKNYYQFQQFKKSYFKCIKVVYDDNTGRIIELDFEYEKTGD